MKHHRDYQTTINQLYVNSHDFDEFCREFVRLAADDTFTDELAQNADLQVLFDLAIRYQDNDYISEREQLGKEIQRLASRI